MVSNFQSNVVCFLEALFNHAKCFRGWIAGHPCPIDFVGMFLKQVNSVWIFRQVPPIHILFTFRQMVHPVQIFFYQSNGVWIACQTFPAHQVQVLFKNVNGIRI